MRGSNSSFSIRKEINMRKIIFIVMLFGLFYLQGCEKEPEETELICKTNEENINGVCEIILEPEEIALRNALTYADDMSNYQMDITIQNGFELYDIIIEFDDDKSSFEMNLQKEYFEKQQGTLYHYSPAGSQYVKTTVTQNTSDTYQFFKDFEPSWFTYNTNKYLLNMENHEDVQLFFEEAFPGSILSNFEMTITDDYISGMDFMLQVGEISYHLVFEISNVGTVDIVLPVV
jgi:hypothetical protein